MGTGRCVVENKCVVTATCVKRQVCEDGVLVDRYVVVRDRGVMNNLCH